MQFINFRWLDALDILLVAFLIYQLYKIVKGTVAIKIFIGIIALYLFWKIVGALHMELLTEILGKFIGVGVIALIIVFQQELRRFLLVIGNTNVLKDKKAVKRWLNWNWGNNEQEQFDVTPIVNACVEMAKTKTGALIVISKNSNLDLITQTGERINAEISSKILESIFYKNSPLHDGAVIISENKITAAKCVLPVSEQKNIPSDLGLRHRAAIGISEITDTLTIVVSEQTGKISYCSNRKLHNGISKEELITILNEKLNQ